MIHSINIKGSKLFIIGNLKPLNQARFAEEGFKTKAVLLTKTLLIGLNSKGYFIKGLKESSVKVNLKAELLSEIFVLKIKKVSNTSFSLKSKGFDVADKKR